MGVLSERGNCERHCVNYSDLPYQRIIIPRENIFPRTEIERLNVRSKNNNCQSLLIKYCVSLCRILPIFSRIFPEARNGYVLKLSSSARAGDPG